MPAIMRKASSPRKRFDVIGRHAQKLAEDGGVGLANA
jgi:hypothetical protein